MNCATKFRSGHAFRCFHAWWRWIGRLAILSCHTTDSRCPRHPNRRYGLPRDRNRNRDFQPTTPTTMPNAGRWCQRPNTHANKLRKRRCAIRKPVHSDPKRIRISTPCQVLHCLMRSWMPSDCRMETIMMPIMTACQSRCTCKRSDGDPGCRHRSRKIKKCKTSAAACTHATCRTASSIPESKGRQAATRRKRRISTSSTTTHCSCTTPATFVLPVVQDLKRPRCPGWMSPSTWSRRLPKINEWMTEWTNE
mmetsp:Transcript_28562/g.80489  ORF Transcript_28562/g.80489 Transcript_28562/m.80489 type:complete len:251 (+) Transcript_28562:1241-1993(+)